MLTSRDLGITARRALGLNGRPEHPIQTRIISSTGQNCEKWEIVPEMYEKLDTFFSPYDVVFLLKIHVGSLGNILPTPSVL